MLKRERLSMSSSSDIRASEIFSRAQRVPVSHRIILIERVHLPNYYALNAPNASLSTVRANLMIERVLLMNWR